jgi:hypothetical protein
MSNREIVIELTDEQEALIPECRAKWRLIENKIESIDRTKAIETINTAYSISSYSEPEILWYDNPLTAIQEVTHIENFRSYLGRSWACLFDFCISVLKLHYDKKKWTVIQQLVQNCGFLLQYENVCVACDRPSKLSFDAENLLHADGEPALQFADGYSIFAIHGKSPFSNW